MAEHVGKLEVLAAMVAAVLLLTMDFGRPWIWIALLLIGALLLGRLVQRRREIDRQERP